MTKCYGLKAQEWSLKRFYETHRTGLALHPQSSSPRDHSIPTNRNLYQRQNNKLDKKNAERTKKYELIEDKIFWSFEE